MSDDATKSIGRRHARSTHAEAFRDPPHLKRDKKLRALLDAAREVADVVSSGPAFRDNALNALEAAALAWGAIACPICGRRGDHEWEELTGGERVAHEAEAASQGI